MAMGEFGGEFGEVTVIIGIVINFLALGTLFFNAI